MTPDWDWQMPLPQGNGLFDVAFLSGRFLAGGFRGTILSSVDGQTWSVTRLGVSNTIFAFAQGNGTYVALSSFSSLWSSSDGQTWTARESGVGANAGQLTALTFGAGRFVAVGAGGTVVTSLDGANWTPVASGPADSLTALEFGAGKFVALGATGGTWVSTDGASWGAGPILPRAMQRLAFSAGRFVAAADNVLFVSDDGVTWIEKNLGTTARVVALKFTAAGFLAPLNSTDGRYWKSPEGLTCTEQSMNLFLNAPANSLTFGGGRYVMVGDASETLLSSGNGSAWTRPATSSARNFVAAATNGSTVLAIAAGAQARLASDGSGATLDATSGMFADAKDVAFGNGLFAAVAAVGKIATSPNRLTWTTRSSGTTADLLGVA